VAHIDGDRHHHDDTHQRRHDAAANDGSKEATDRARHGHPSCPRLSARRPMAQHRPTIEFEGAAGQVRFAGLLDLLLNQLLAHAAAVAAGGTNVSQRIGRHRRPLSEVPQ